MSLLYAITLTQIICAQSYMQANVDDPEAFITETEYMQAISRLGNGFYAESKPNVDITHENFLQSAHMFGVVIESGAATRVAALGKQYYAEKEVAASAVEKARQAMRSARASPAPSMLEGITFAPPPIMTLEADRLRSMMAETPDSAGNSGDVELAPEETAQSIWGHLANAATVEVAASNLSQRVTSLGRAFFVKQKEAAVSKVQEIRDAMRSKVQLKQASPTKAQPTAADSLDAALAIELPSNIFPAPSIINIHDLYKSPPTQSPDDIEASNNTTLAPTASPDERDGDDFDEHAVSHAHDVSAIA